MVHRPEKTGAMREGKSPTKKTDRKVRKFYAGGLIQSLIGWVIFLLVGLFGLFLLIRLFNRMFPVV
jgi:hypothetical protein